MPTIFAAVFCRDSFLAITSINRPSSGPATNTDRTNESFQSSPWS